MIVPPSNTRTNHAHHPSRPTLATTPRKHLAAVQADSDHAHGRTEARRSLVCRVETAHAGVWAPAQPLTTPMGRRRATRLARPARSQVATTSVSVPGQSAPGPAGPGGPAGRRRTRSACG